ncbi:MAG: hypothetical protein V4714_11860 [Bacteroidota bacterium]
MKLNKKTSTKNLLYANIDLTDENLIDDSPKASKRLGKFVKKMKGHYDNAVNRSGSFRNSDDYAY